MKLYLGLLESSLPDQTRIFGEIDGKLIDLKLAYAASLTELKGNTANAYDLASFYFPSTIAAHLEHADPARKALDELVAIVHRRGVRDLRGPADEKITHEKTELRMLPPIQHPEKSFVIGFSDRARIEAMPKGEIPTGFYKLPQTFVTSDAPIVWPKFSAEVDADACIAIVIGKTGRRIAPENAWDHIAGATLMVDITARDVNRREGLTTNNLLGKNFPSSTCLGPSMLLSQSRKEFEDLVVELSVDGVVKQKFALRDCVFPLEQIIAHWSILGIKPGDWFAVGASMALRDNRLQNPVPLKLGSTLRCSAPAIGELCHQIVSTGGARR